MNWRACWAFITSVSGLMLASIPLRCFAVCTYAGYNRKANQSLVIQLKNDTYMTDQISKLLDREDAQTIEFLRDPASDTDRMRSLERRITHTHTHTHTKKKSLLGTNTVNGLDR